MKTFRSFSNRLVVFGAAMLATALITEAQAQSIKQGSATVRAVRGKAQYSTGAGWAPIRVGIILRSGSIIKTAPESQVDLFLGKNGPVVRVTEDTEMALDKLTFAETGAEDVIETQLDLKSGRILGNVKKLAAASRYEVKTPNAVAAIRGTEYEVEATGRVTVLSGLCVVSYIDKTTGQPARVNVPQGMTFDPNTQTVGPIPIRDIARLKDIFRELGTFITPFGAVTVTPLTDRTVTPREP